MADAAEPVTAGADMSLQNVAGFLAVAQIDVADDAGTDFRRTVAAGGAHRGDAVDEFGLADRAESLRTLGSVHGAALQENGGDDVVAAVDVGQQVVEHVYPVRAIPEMVVRIDDRQVGLQDRLFAAREPVVADGDVGAGRGGGAHAGVSSFWPSILSRRAAYAKRDARIGFTSLTEAAALR